jgi:hypothetical protein
MENVQRVTAHLGRQAAGQSEASRRVLTLIPARDGRAWHYAMRDGNHWRVYIFIEKARTFDAVESTQQAFQAAKAFGQFQKLLADLPAPRLHDTIPDFHHTPKRFAALEKAIEADAANRASGRAGNRVRPAPQAITACCSTQTCRSASRTTTPSSTTSCSTTRRARGFA